MTRTRSGFSGLLAALALVATLLSAVLTASTAVAPAASAAGQSSSWGSVDASRQKLRPGCHGYRFTYRIDAPGTDWMAELVLVSPDGVNLASHTFKRSAGDPARDTRRFRFCDVTTTPGRHTITLRVTAYDARSEATRRSAPERFRLVRR